MTIDGIQIRRIRTTETTQCVGQIPGRAIVSFNGNAFCAACFGAEILGGEHSPALIGHFCSLLLDN
jgi:hypothetical protein